MKNSGIKVTTLTNEEMLNHESKSYNEGTWKKAVNEMINLGATFYEAKPDKLYSYPRFFASYRTPNDGLFIFKSFSPYASVLSAGGFTRIVIIDGELYTNGFGPNMDKRAANHKDARKWLVENISANNVMVTADL